MQEQSQKEEMRAALRGDFERLHARRGGEPSAEIPDAASPVAETPAPRVTPPGEIAEAPAGRARRPWRDRLLGRT